MHFTAALLSGLLTFAAPAAATGADPFSWLADSASPPAREWTARQEQAAQNILAVRPGREAVRRVMTEAASYGTLQDLAVRGRRVFYRKRSGSSQRPILYMRDIQAAEPIVVLSEDQLSSSTLAWWQPSQDGLLLAYGVATPEAGEVELRVREADSAADLPDRISRVPEDTIAWLPDRTGFYYARSPDPAAASPQKETSSRFFFHTLGTDPSRDNLVFKDSATHERCSAQVSADGRLLVLFIRRPSGNTEILMQERQQPAAGFVSLPMLKGPVRRGWLNGRTLYLLTDDDASRGGIIALDLRQPRRPRRREMTAPGPLVVTDFILAREGLASLIAENASSRLQLHDRTGRPVREIPVPGEGSVTALAADPGRDELFFIWESLFSAPGLYRYDARVSSLTRIDSIPGPGPAEFKLRRLELPASDGSRMSMLLTSNPWLKRDGENPTILSGLPCRGLAGRPAFSPLLVSWLRQGGMWAAPILPGIGGCGQPEPSGSAVRQKAADDLAAAGRWLVENGYTRPSRLAILNRSPEAPFAATAAGQAPELFAAAVLDRFPADWPRQTPFPPFFMLAGPDAGLPLSRQIEAGTDIQTFLLWKMGLEKPEPARKRPPPVRQEKK